MNRTSKKYTFKEFFGKTNTYVMFLILFIVCSVASDTFLSWTNIGNLLRQNTAIVWVCMGMLMVIVSGEIDLSVGAIVGVSSVLCATLLNEAGFGPIPAVIITLIVCLGFGLANGVLVAYAKMPSFIVTLAMAEIAKGIALYICHGAPVQLSGNSIQWIATLKLGSGNLGEILSFLTILLIIIAIVIWFVMKYTAFGRHIFAVGSNAVAVRLAGIKVRSLKLRVFMLTGLFCGVAGVIGASRTKSGNYGAGSGWELNAIAACVIGGASLAGGEGSVPKTIVGVFVLALITNIMNLCAIPSYPQSIIKGVIIIVAVLAQTKSFKEG